MTITMKRMFWILFSGTLLITWLAVAEEKPFTAERHKKNNVTCAGCHGEAQPKTAATEKSCLQCHKSMEAVAERTKDYQKNPHQNHLTDGSDVACTLCHHGHKADAVVCNDCHSGMTFEKEQKQ